MNKTDVIKTIQGVSKEFGFDLTQDNVDDLLKIFAKSYEVLGEELEIGDSVNVGVTVLTKKKTKARSGVSKLGEQEMSWSVPEKIKLVISTKKSFEKEHEQEI
ncbi:hypothetical protein [Terrisporobacter sp.]|uniref:hypothetical protein n=1 Tax=Terrisporobacter sp. TaxID=1965305 RepID=UPI0028A01CC0|nr:hypothetical protein [Terrisporobacter sp.]